MGLLQSLNLCAPGNRDTAAKPAALRRARRAVRRREGAQRAVLEAAIDAASKSGSNSPTQLDGVVIDDDNPGEPVSTMAPRDAYDDLEAGKPEDKGLPGRTRNRIDVQIEHQGIAEDPSHKTEFQVTSTVELRELAKDRLGRGERIWKQDGKGGMRQPDGFKSPEKLVIAHEHLHLVVSAHVAARLDEFAEAAFHTTAFDEETGQALEDLLEKIADDTKEIVNHWLDRVSVPDHPGEIRHSEKVTERLLKDGSVERQVRTALLEVVRKNARALAKFRKP